MTTADPPAPPGNDDSPTAALARLVQPGPGETHEQALDRIARAMLDEGTPEETAARLMAPLPGEEPDDTYRRLTQSRELVRIRPLAVIFGGHEETIYDWRNAAASQPAGQGALPPEAKVPRMLNPHGWPLYHLGELLLWGEQAGKLVWSEQRDGTWYARTVTGAWVPLAELREQLGVKRVAEHPTTPGICGFTPIRYTRLMRPGPARKEE